MLTCSLFRRFLVVLTELHLAKDSLGLHSLFEEPKSLVDIIVANEDLHRVRLSDVDMVDVSRPVLWIAEEIAKG